MAKVAKTLHSLGDHLQVGASVRNVYGATQLMSADGL